MKKPKRATAAKAKTGRKTSAGRSKAAPKRPARPAPRGASAADDAKATIKAIIRGLRSKLKLAERRIAELEAAADTDFLLEIPNRRGFERELARAIAYMKRYRASGALIVLDVDRLKPINDSFGHAAGDEVLKVIAGALTRQIRASDVVGRLGGDEFALLLWNLTETDAKAKAATLEQAIDDLSFTFRGQRVTAGASAGVALLGAQSDAGRALEEADAAMYVRKARRRHEPRIRLVSS
ncbi:GGDEF domain-containing protein [Bradyrhizobium cosmicum]|uniref:GGDEF domain-containing protein n=1 Tax=Bradyrhizobium cosmicum TaxID=1404864 RepID=UPI0028F055F9|nr:GGDEF domain-containing protein [Bradyrhizobium cosmicum]